MKLTKIAAGAAALLMAAAMTACGGDATPGGTDTPVATDAKFAAGSTMEKLNKAQKITIGTKFDQPLFGLMGPDNKPVGFDVEIGTLVAAKLGIPADKIEWVETVSQNREPFIQNGQVDIVVATYTINDKRKEVIDFAGPYYVAGQSFLVAKGNPAGIKDVESLGDNTICTVTGSTSEKNIKEHTDKVITVDKYSDCLEPIRTGQAQALTTDNVILAGLVDQNGDEFEVLDYTFTEEPYGIGLKKGDDDFRTFINDTLEESEKDGAWKKAWEDTAGKVLPTPEPPAVDRY
ncbi:ABC transporter substrate-binding protein [Tessaracoccus aquimaris]|uniref:ABC transporter substrate-binding protein n=1 Tax=Tessaracoccus aquimaris TaxID=1332264 RepID=A0A1Q2CJL3_9ACTN|nr:glutamate ABC transporter substrate-binding protein [Tessaracoccus aquimaris]AQP46273.1 ABC transporter substrate-binding protein [Tessaracoccus aquimaris]